MDGLKDPQRVVSLRRRTNDPVVGMARTKSIRTEVVLCLPSAAPASRFTDCGIRLTLTACRKRHPKRQPGLLKFTGPPKGFSVSLTRRVLNLRYEIAGQASCMDAIIE
jgi:hypothetical protein